MSYSLTLYSRVREYLMTHSDEQDDVSRMAAHIWKFSLLQEPTNSYDEVYPGIYMGDMREVGNRALLKSLGITHMLNCSQGKGQRETNTDARFYRDFNIKFHGIKAMDSPTFNMMPFFKAAVEFIDKALKAGGKVFVHCYKGISRSATIVIAYLMIKHRIKLLDATHMIREKRKIRPNDGFIRQLCILHQDLFEKN